MSILFLTKTLLTLVAIGLFYLIAFTLLHLLDKRSQSFNKSIEVISSNPIALSIYLAVRFATVLFTMGWIVCLVFLI